MDLDRRSARWMAPALSVAALVELAGRLDIGSHARVGSPLPGTTSIRLIGPGTLMTSQELVALAVLSLLTTVPLWFSRSTVAAVVTFAAAFVSLGSFSLLTGAGLVALLLAAYRLGRGPAWSGWLAGALVLPFPGLVLAGVSGVSGASGASGASGGELRVMVVLMASLGPAAVLAGVASSRAATTRGAVEQAVAGVSFEHMARGERARIARELHDVVAHHISMVSVQAETARLTTPGMPELGARRLREIGDTARAGLTEMRRLLGVLREDAAGQQPERQPAARQPQPGLPQLNDLIDEARKASGGGVRLIVSGQVTRLDPGVELAVYRIVQEALTNSRRHAPGAAVDVELRYGPDALLLRVRDNGPGGAPAGSGHGLVGMRERAQSVGGELRAGPASGGGFLVEAALPATGQAVSAESAA